MHCFYRYIVGRSLFAVRNLIGAQLSHERFALSDRRSEHREWLVLSDTGHTAKVSANVKEVKGLMQWGLASVTPSDANGTAYSIQQLSFIKRCMYKLGLNEA